MKCESRYNVITLKQEHEYEIWKFIKRAIAKKHEAFHPYDGNLKSANNAIYETSVDGYYNWVFRGSKERYVRHWFYNKK